MALVKDKSFNKSVKLYADNQDKFFDEYVAPPFPLALSSSGCSTSERVPDMPD